MASCHEALIILISVKFKILRLKIMKYSKKNAQQLFLDYVTIKVKLTSLKIVLAITIA